jgi:hypothetical protein
MSQLALGGMVGFAPERGNSPSPKENPNGSTGLKIAARWRVSEAS